MRLGIALSASGDGSPHQRLAAQAQAAETAGLEFVWLEPELVDEPLHCAAALSATTDSIRVIACVPARWHPLDVAEQASVVDNCLAGRLVLVISGDEQDAELLPESAEVLLAATASRPFSHCGRSWQIPAMLPENDGASAEITVTPAPVQIELPLWLTGAGARTAAQELALPYVCGIDETSVSAATGWAQTQAQLGRAALRLRRPAQRSVTVGADGRFDDEKLVLSLREEQRLWGLDVAILRLPPGLDRHAFGSAIRRIATRVRPRLIQDQLPAGLEAHWRERWDNDDRG